MSKDQRPENSRRQLKKEKKPVGEKDAEGSSSSDSITTRRHRMRPSPSSRGRRYRDGDWPAVQRVVKESGGAKYPTLTRSNYTHWSLVMKVMLQTRNL
jgi:hypothetical protein